MADGQLFAGAVTEAERLDWLRLIRSRRVGAVTFHRLIGEHGSAGAALAALPEIARAAGVEGYAVCPVEVAAAEVRAARQKGARMLCHGEAGYPVALMDLADAPPLLWAIGDVALLHRPMVAMVGARNASSLGVRMARRLAEGLAQAGQVVVSGLARGIDAEAHRAALATGTVAVMAGGVDVVYPAENAALHAEIAGAGCLVSEQPMGMEPQARHFPLRNRIVSGLARAVIVVEAAARSGSLITARTALDQGRDVMAVPGHPFDARASGCNMLIRDGATLVRGAQDVLEVIGAAMRLAEAPVPRPAPLPGPAPVQRSLKEMSVLHDMILSRLGPSPVAEDQLVRDLAITSAQLAPELLTLELDGRVLRQPGGLLSRAD
ncbi:MAG: DNA-processing protein DprA [Tabrizicola sp.]|uniref:DNA-processing protein DprA n=1 Tax=Tabrizicola sp. TaxID=2005166 RepID=UPI0027337B56|nr:DNA-processing protein DprA [Tabrizicola sp.]MDP3263648.1 DNA-processing protein DprA [Tabrizicola sp.]MDP3647012.1 DNA-processing protein DprA [Paracoccaceae bacterium]MDZ4069856.1 DNA-processing protein DprA [Tabrizicola sp.]